MSRIQARGLVEFVIAHAGVGLVLESPQDYQVVQRNAKNVGTVRVRGKIGAGAEKADALEYRLGTDGKPGVWKKFDATIKDGKFDATIEVAAGGWCRFEVCAVAARKVVAQVSLERVTLTRFEPATSWSRTNRLTPTSLV